MVHLICFPWAGGTSALYKEWTDGIHHSSSSVVNAFHEKRKEVSCSCGPVLEDSSFHVQSVNYPGRLLRQGDPKLTDMSLLAETLVCEILSNNNQQKNDEEQRGCETADNVRPAVADEEQDRKIYVLFGHSFGAIVAFEVAKRLEARGCSVLALFVTASRPPSASSLASSDVPVSEMSIEEMQTYFESRGNAIDPQILEDSEMTELFLNSVCLDYRCLESYQANDRTLRCPIFAFGGELDPGVSKHHVESWRNHTSCDDNLFLFKMFQGQGHYFLNNPATFEFLSKFIAEKTVDLLLVQCEDSNFVNEDLVSTVANTFSKVLKIPLSGVDRHSNFFYLGGTSLDTMTLTTLLKAAENINVTQNEFFMHPTVESLAIRIESLKQDSEGVPVLLSIDGSDGSIEKDFPASYGQEQMVACWEMSPAMYNMPTTIEFHGAIDFESMKRAFRHVVQQQTSLRTVVRVDPVTNDLYQRVLEADRVDECFELVVIDAKDDDYARKIIETESVHVFDLMNPPVLRGVLVRVSSSPHEYLLINQHHVGSDGWSRTILRRQLIQFYLRFSGHGDSNTLSIPAHPNYVDFTIWTRRWLFEYGQQDRQLEYWKKQLHSLPVLDLPTDRPRPTVLSSKGMRLPVRIDAKMTSAFEALVTANGTNLYSGLIALYTTVLHRLGGGDDFAIGIALANRHHEGLENIVGYFANEVAIRAKFTDQSMAFVDVLKNIRENVLHGMANADVPFHKVTEALQIARDRSRTSVFQAMFALQEREWHSVDDLCPRDGKVRFNLKQFDHNTSKFEVHLQLRKDGEGGLEGDFHIATDLFTRETGERIVKAYIKLMDECIKHPQIPIYSHDIVSSYDYDLIKTSNATDMLYEGKSIIERILANDRNSVAFLSDGEEAPVTYAELCATSHKVASYLRQSVLKENETVGILMKTSKFAIASIVGVNLARCVNVIQDVEKTPVERCAMIFKDASVKVVIIDDEYKTKFEKMQHPVHFIGVNEILASTSCDNAEFSPTDSCDDDVFGIYYTSGTTGVPKGVIITMENVTNLVNWWTEFFCVSAVDRILLFSSLSFIMSIRQYLPTLCAGGTVVLPKSSLEFESAILHGKVTKLICTPSALASLDLVSMASCNLEAVQVAGEAPQLNTMMSWKDIVGKLFIGLGPTELCAHALCGEFDGSTISIGHPAKNVRAYVVDPVTHLQCPVNVSGELWVSGRNVAAGYLNKAKETGISFSTDPQTGLRMYKTGDFARRLSDGRIQFIGRRDKQLKVNGFRIEQGDVMNAVPSEVRNAHLIVQNQRLILYIAPVVDKNVVFDKLRSTLPAYMVPSSVVPVEYFPLNKNEKLDVEKLVEMGKDVDNLLEFQNLADEVHIMSEVESTIRLVWAEVLRIDMNEISQDDNFFAKGGTSLSAVIVSRKLSFEFQTEVGVEEVFASQTIKELAAAINKSTEVVQHSGDPNPLVFLQDGRHALHPFIFGVLQAFGLLLMSIIAIVPVLATVFVSVRSFIWFGNVALLSFPLLVIAGCLFHMSLVLLCKWTMIGRYKPGKAKVFSWMFLKWWLVRRVMAVTILYTWMFDETPFSRFWLRALGASVGNNVSVESPILLEPDLVHIGDDCVAEFEVQFATSEIKCGILELRPTRVGARVKLGARAILLGGADIHNGSEVLSKATVDFYSSTTGNNQVLVGSPAKPDGHTSGNIWLPRRGLIYSLCQMLGCVLQLFFMAGVVYAGTSIGITILNKYGSFGLVIYLGSAFNIIASSIWLVVVALLHWLLIPRLKAGKVYEGNWFALRKWFMDRMFLSPLFSYTSQRMLQTSSTFPWYMQLLGAKIGKKAWLNHPHIRVGVELIEIGDHCHMGMLSYFTTQRFTPSGISFHRIRIQNHVSFGQRCVILNGAYLGSYTTVGAETMIPQNFIVDDGGTTFGCPPVRFTSSAAFRDIIDETQRETQHMITERNQGTDKSIHQADTGVLAGPSSRDSVLSQAPTRMQDIGQGQHFWTYVIAMILIQASLPLLIGISYGGIYYLLTYWFYFQIEYLILAVPAIYVMGSVVLMIMMKVLQMLAGNFSSGTADFFSFRFFTWHIFADMVYLCTSTVIYPFSGTELYCIWLRFMGAKVGKRAFISPENGGFREIDFLDIGDDAVLMTPNIHAHYTDHGMLQFCPVKLEDGVEINSGATIMPLTKYGKNSRLRPFAVTVKGQVCSENTAYIGNPCKAIKMQEASSKGAILFPGQGSQYPGMLSTFEDVASLELIDKASSILGLDLSELSSASSIDSSIIEDTVIAQPLVLIGSLLAAERMRRTHPVDFSKVVACAGLSLGELTALCFARALTFEDCIRLVKVRASAMAKCNGGAMCNVQGLDRKQVELLCRKFGLTISNVLCDHEDSRLIKDNVFICSGTGVAVDKFVADINLNADCENGRGRSKRLRVSAAFHSKSMKPAQKALEKALKDIPIIFPENVLVYSNVTGNPYRSVSEIRTLLVKHLVSPVQWHKTMKDMQENEQVGRFFECGPMHSLSTLVKKINPEISSSRVISSDA